MINKTPSKDSHDYGFLYHHRGDLYSINITANSPEDAKERIKALQNAEYLGQLMTRIPVPEGNVIYRLLRKWLDKIK